MENRFAVVTGAAGFVGNNVARNLVKQGWDVATVGHGKTHLSGLTQELVADISVAALEKLGDRIPERIYHCAGSGSVFHSVEHPLDDFYRSVCTVAEVLEYARLHAPDAVIIYPSSGAVYGNAASSPITETTKLKPVSPYGWHKCAAEDLCKLYANQYKVSIAIVRLFSIFGNGLRKQLLWDACRKISANHDLTFFGTGQETRDWIHVNDTVRLLDQAATHASGECLTINGGRGVGLDVKTILCEVFKAFGRTDQPEFLGEQRTGDPSVVFADITRAKSLGWQPQENWQAAIHDYVRWFQSENS